MADITFDKCFYFAVSTLNRKVTKMAEDEFAEIGLSPTHAFLLVIAYVKPGILPTELSERLQVTPSTVTRFLDKLEHRGLLIRQWEGKTAAVYLTDRGKQLLADIGRIWNRLSRRYEEILGEGGVSQLTQMINESGAKMKD